MYIVSSAIKCRPINSMVDYIIVTGHCHADCYEALSFGYDMYVLANPGKYDYVEGYMCDDGSFVDRFEATNLAHKSNQMKDLYKDFEGALQSYMLNYVT